MVAPPSPPFIQAKHFGGYQDPHQVKRIVIHSTVSDTYVGAARAIANYFANPTYVSSAHYAVDPEQVYQMVNDWNVAWHDGTNTSSFGIEMCERPTQNVGRWNTAEHTKLLENTAQLVRTLCLAYGIPMRHLTIAQIRNGEAGICSHADMRDAFPGSTSHWDPGAFPWNRFIDLVNRETDDMFSDHDRALLDTLTHQLRGAVEPDQWPGFPSHVDPSVSLTPVDFARWIHAYVYRSLATTAEQNEALARLAEAVGLVHGVDAATLLAEIHAILAEEIGPISVELAATVTTDTTPEA